MRRFASALQLFGLVILSAGVWMYSAALGMVVSGATLTLVGLAMERSD
jgi:hypothetical protein